MSLSLEVIAYNSVIFKRLKSANLHAKLSVEDWYHSLQNFFLRVITGEDRDL